MLTRISATVAALGVLTMVATGFLMWWKRRSRGGTGLPSPAGAATRAHTSRHAVLAISISALALGVLFPVFGISLLVVLGAERVLARRRRRDDADVGPAPAPEEDGDDVPEGVLQNL